MIDDDGDSIYGGEGSGVAEDPDSGISTSTPLPVKRTGEVSMLVQSTITKASPVIANPSSKHANMDHPRTCMMLDTDPGSDAPLAQKWYKWATPGTHQASHEATPDDGSAKVIVSKMNDVMCELASSPSPEMAGLRVQRGYMNRGSAIRSAGGTMSSSLSAVRYSVSLT